MKSQFNLVDGVSFTISQCFYWPSYHKDNADLAYVEHNNVDQRYDAKKLPIVEVRTGTAAVVEAPDESITRAVYDTLITGSGLRYHDALSLAVLCKSSGITCAQYKQIVFAISASDSALRTNRVDLSDLYDEAYSVHMTAAKKAQLYQRLGCKVINVPKTQKITTGLDRDKYKLSKLVAEISSKYSKENK
jgi:carbon starvation protein CstA